MNYKLSIIIPTYNRAEDLAQTLNSLLKHEKEFQQLIIVDQSKDDVTRLLLKGINNQKIKYIHSIIPSITRARNLGLKYISNDCEYVLFLDDDVDIGDNYFEEMMEAIKIPNVKGAAAFDDSPCNENMFISFIKRLFFLRYRGFSATMTCPYGNNYPKELEGMFLIAEWLPGVNMFFKKEVFDELRFDEHLLGYTIAEDTDFTYRVNKKYSRSLVITPFAKFKHRGSRKERLNPKRMAYVNQVDHFYFFFKNMQDKKFRFIWSLIGLSIFKAFTFDKYYFQSLNYCLNNLDKIKQGKLREWDC